MTHHPIDSTRQATLVAADRLVAFFESLTPGSLDEIGDFYAPDAYFKDPFNEVHDLAAIKGIFSHMYKSLDKPRFVVTECMAQDGQCFLTWNFEFYFRTSDRATVQTLRGASHLRFNHEGLINYHRDYWDAAEELYEKLPLLGALMRWLKKRVRA
jgi:steroid delta-isomerase